MEYQDRHQILIVDDEPDNLDALERLFRKKYNVLRALSGGEALSLISKSKDPISLIVTDQRMPQMSGVDFLKESLKILPKVPKILLTGYSDLNSVIAAINVGEIYRYVTKPWDPIDLQKTVETAIEKYELDGELAKKNASLNQALEELKTLDRAKSHFMILINHELKTPLTSILNFASLLKESALGENEVRYLLRIQQNAQRLQNLIEDVLLIMKAEVGVLPKQKNRINLSALVERIEGEVRLKNTKSQQKISLDLEPKEFFGCEFHLALILSKLLDNAMKFSPPNSTIQLKASVDPRGILFETTNEGSALAPEWIERIKKPFVIQEEAMNHSVGTGLGLTVAASLLKSLGQTLDITSTQSDPALITCSFLFPG